MFNPISNFKKKRTAFSLIELSIVILIISILVAGAVSLLATSSDSYRKKLTQERIKVIYKAIGNYVAKYYHLPCPAPMTDTKSDSGYATESGGGAIANNTARDCNGTGIYQSNNVSSINYGMVPVNSLGLADEMAEDGFGNRFAYVVTDNLVSPNYNDISGGFSEGFSYYVEVSADMIQIYSAKSSNIIKQNVAFAIISQGANKHGAYGSNSTTQNNASLATTQESYNILSNISANKADFGNNATYSGYVTLGFDDSDGDFDDTVFYKTRDEIIGDFNLGFLYFCDNNDDNYDDINYTPSFNYGYNGQVVYGDGLTGCDGDNFMIPSKKCGLNGTVWIDVVACPDIVVF